MVDVMRCIFATLGLLNTSAGQESECAWTVIYLPLFFSLCCKYATVGHTGLKGKKMGLEVVHLALGLR